MVAREHPLHGEAARTIRRVVPHLDDRAVGVLLEEQWEPWWDKVVLNSDGSPKLDAGGNPAVERARLDLLLEAPPKPRIWGDVVVSHTGAFNHERAASQEDGAAAKAAWTRKVRRYPPEVVRPARMLPLSMETWGR